MSHRVRRILIVDDDPDIRGVIQEFLQPEGYDVRMAASGREAFGILDGEDVDLVLTDLVMPEREGIEIIQEIRRSFPSVKTVAMSGALFSPYLRAAELLGAHAALSKPLNSSLLRLTLQQVLTANT